MPTISGNTQLNLAMLVVVFTSPLAAQHPRPELTAIATGPSTVLLAWTPVGGATQYWARRDVDPKTLRNLSSPKITDTTYTDATALAGTTLYYQIMAGFADGTKSYSSVVSVTTVPSVVSQVSRLPVALQVAPAQAMPAASAITSSSGQPSLGIETAAPASTVTQASPPTGASTINTGEMARQATRPQGAAPQGLIATTLSPTSVRLTWLPTVGATEYTVYRGAGPEGVPPIATVPAPSAGVPAAGAGQRTQRPAPGTNIVAAMTYLDNSVTPHSTFYYRVAATYDNQQTGFTPAVSATTPVASQPTGFLAVAGLGSVTLSWHPAPGATGYMLSRDNSVFLNNQQLIRDTTYVDDGLNDGLWTKTYTYRLIAYYTVQGIGMVTGDMTQVPAVVATPRKASPKDFRMDPYYGGTVVDFRWTPFQFESYGGVINYPAKGYKILRALASDGNFAEVSGMQYSGLEGNPSRYEFARDNTVQVGETYLYKLETIGSTPPGESEVLRVEVNAKLAGIQDLTGSSPQSGTVVLHWTPPPGAEGYVILRGGGPYHDRMDNMTNITRAVPPLDLAGTVSSYTDSNILWRGYDYRYNVVTWYGGYKWGEASVDVHVR